MLNEQILREQICEIGRSMYARGFVAANDGNISVRLPEERVLTTPTGVSKGFMSPQSLVVVNMNGTPLDLNKPSSEIRMHLFLYRERPEVQAVVHAHPVYATGFATAGLALEGCVAPEIIATLGSVPLARYGTPSTEELAESLRPFVHRNDAFLLANHGVVAVGRDLWEAYYRVERVEHYAHVLLISRLLGGEIILPKYETEKLLSLREKYGQSGLNPGCAACEDECLGSACLNYAEKYNVESEDRIGRIAERILERL